jgi:hypothetical protein
MSQPHIKFVVRKSRVIGRIMMIPDTVMARQSLDLTPIAWNRAPG